MCMNKKWYTGAIRPILRAVSTFILAIILGKISIWLVESIVPRLVPTNATFDSYRFWLGAGFAIGFGIAVFWTVARHLSSRRLKVVAAICAGLAILGVIVLFHEAKAFRLRALPGAPIDHLYWIAMTFWVGLISGGVFCPAYRCILGVGTPKSTD